MRSILCPAAHGGQRTEVPVQGQAGLLTFAACRSQQISFSTDFGSCTCEILGKVFFPLLWTSFLVLETYPGSTYFSLTGQRASKTKETLNHQGKTKGGKLKEFTCWTVQQKRQWGGKRKEKEEKQQIIQYFNF